MPANTYSALWFQLFMPLQSEEMTRKDVAFLARQLPLPRYHRVLDLCCGYGRHALPLAERGYAVMGMDRDEEAIATARQLAARSSQPPTYRVADMRELGDLSGSFDGVINMWQSLSYFDEDTNERVLRDIYSKLTSGGRFIVDLYNRDYFERNQGDKRQIVNGVTVETHGYMRGHRWHSELAYRDEHGVVIGGDHMDWQLYTPDEFIAFAAACGFSAPLACTWSDETIPPSAGVARMQIVLEKP